MTSPKLMDKDWLRQAFMVTQGPADGETELRRRRPRGYHKFSDNTLGGCQAINPLPQYCKYTDLPEKRLFNQTEMGRWYSENIEDNYVYLHVRCGNPMFNGLTTFFTTFYNSQASSLARTGRTNTFFYTLGQIGGFVVSWFLSPLIFVGTMVDILTSKPKTKYYYMKPAMTSYWAAVQNIVNTIMVNKGMLIGQQPGEDPNGEGARTKEEVDFIQKLLPEEFTRSGQFDIYAVSTKYQRRANRMFSRLRKAQEDATSVADLQKRVMEQQESALSGGGFMEFSDDRPVSLQGYVESYLQRPTTDVNQLQQIAYQKETKTTTEEGAAESKQENKDVGLFEDMIESVTSYFTKETAEALVAELNDGGQFISFRVDNPGSISESFQTSTKESTIASSINNMSKNAQDVRFNFADGKLTDSWIGKAIGSVMNAARSFVGGIASSLQVSGLATLFGNALVDIPRYWDNSTSQLPTMSYTFQLRQTYGDDLSSVQDMWVQVAALLAMALPLSTGPSSYTQPFVCEAYCPGRAQSRLCMVESLSLTRGVGPKGWTRNNKPTAIDVSITFVVMDSVMHMPITAGYSPFNTVFTPGGISRMLAGDEGAFADYMATISSLGLVEQIYPFRKLKRNFYKGMADINSWLSPHHAASWVGGTGLGRTISGLFAATNRA